MHDLKHLEVVVTAAGKNWRKALAAAVTLMAAAFALYANTFGATWTYDDFPVIVNNADVRSMAAFLENANPGRPLRELTYVFDHALFGMDPAGWHIQQVFWHGLNAILLWLLALRLGAGRVVAWMAALLFLVHPIQVEVVANISHRKDSLALAFSLLAALCYLWALGGEKGRLLRLAGVAGTGALWWVAYQGKQHVGTLPLALAACELAVVPKGRRLLTRWPWLWAVGALTAAVWGAWWYLGAGGRAVYLRSGQFVLSKLNYLDTVTEGVYWPTVFKSWLFMGGKVLWPQQLGVEYAFAIPSGWFDPAVLAALAAAGLFFAVLWLTARRAPLAFVSLAWAGALYLPLSNVWPLTYFAADRYLYTSMAGLCLLAALLLTRLTAGLGRWRHAPVAALLVVLSFLTWQQNRVWKDEFSLWSQAVAVSPDSVYALNNLGVMYGRQGDMEKAFALIGKAAENPFYAEAQLNMGRLYQWRGDQQKALHYMRRGQNPHGQ